MLAFRRELAKLGLAAGFQWLDGSFVEHVELVRGRAPADIDVVTFADLGGEAGQQRLFAQNQALFIPDAVKAQFSVDAYYMEPEPADGRGVGSVGRLLVLDVGTPSRRRSL